MVSLLLPSNVKVFIAPGFLKRTGPLGTRIRKTGSLQFRLLDTDAGRRIVVLPSIQPSISTSKIPTPATALAHFAAHREGLTQGVRCRLRLVGVGFRAIPSGSLATGATSGPTPAGTAPAALTLKLGYSHEVVVPLAPKVAEGITITSSRLDGRTKATLLRIQGASRVRVNQTAVTLRSLRVPDPYKAKGIQYDRESETLKLKKGKREG
jgi:ribosomal protein L6P/L9E